MNPSKIKTLSRTFSAVPGAVWRKVLELGRNAAAAFTWLQSHIDGWRFDVVDLAQAIGLSPRTAYRAVAELESSGFLRRESEAWTLLLPSVTGDTPRAVAKERAGISSKRIKQHTSYVESTNVAGSPKPDGSVCIHGRNKQRMERKPMDSDKPEPVKAQPNNTPDHHNREPLPIGERMNPRDFVTAWTRNFRNGPNRSMVGLASAWQDRVLWIWQYWTRQEIHDAFKATDEKAPSNDWKYFCGCLAKLAEGTAPSDYRPAERVISAAERQAAIDAIYDGGDE